MYAELSKEEDNPHFVQKRSVAGGYSTAPDKQTPRSPLLAKPRTEQPDHKYQILSGVS